MSSSKHKDDLSIALIAEIFNEYSVIQSDIGELYLRHFNQIDATSILIKQEIYAKKAEQDGLPTEENSLKFLIEEGMWDEEKEKEIQKKEDFLNNLKKSTSKISLPSQRENHKSLIKKEQEKLDKLTKERDGLIGLTAEKFAQKKSNRDFFESIVFFDKEFKKPVLENIEYDAKDIEIEITKIQSKFFEKFSEANISKAVLSTAYSLYFPFSDDIQAIFGKPLREMTTFQLKLANYGRTFLNIFKNSDKEIPDNVARDPELLIEFAESLKNSRKGGTKSTEGDGGSMVFGATDDDVKRIKSEEEDAVTLHEALNKEGKQGLNMQDLMKMHGV